MMSPAVRLTRRDLLRGKPKGSPRRMTFRPETGPAGDILVVVFLRGGMDGLHVVPALGDPAYRKQRPTLALSEPGKPKDAALPLDGFYGLHPKLAPLRDLFQAQKLAIVHAIGSPDKTLSHFEAMQTMERGVGDGNLTASGWIARHLAALENGNQSPMRALAIAEVLPKSMQGAIAATAVRSLSDYRLNLPDKWQEPFRDLLGDLYQAGDDPIQAAGRSTLQLLGDMEKLDPAKYQPEGGAVYPDTGLGKGLRQVAQLIKADLGLEIAEVDLGGWDAHAVQDVLMSGLMDELGRSLHAFYSDLGDRTRRVTVVAMSEFGRRVHENSGLGTDHGRGTAMFLMGGGIRGGKVYGQWPGVADHQLDRDGNLVVTTDYRDVLGELVERRLGNTRVSQVFPDYTPRPLALTA